MSLPRYAILNVGAEVPGDARLDANACAHAVSAAFSGEAFEMSGVRAAMAATNP
jgi:hypothetical protein